MQLCKSCMAGSLGFVEVFKQWIYIFPSAHQAPETFVKGVTNFSAVSGKHFKRGVSRCPLRSCLLLHSRLLNLAEAKTC